MITGASSGIGREIARQLSDQGAITVLAARRVDRLDSLATELAQGGGRALAVPTDVTDEAQCQALVQHTMDAFGRIDLLVNNAGIGFNARLQDSTSLDLFHWVMDVNYGGTLHCTFYALPHLLATQGRVVNIASLASWFALPYNSAYTASKFAIRGFSDTLRLDLAGSGASVTVIYPFWVVSEFHEVLLTRDGQPRGHKGRKIYTKRTMTSAECARLTLRAAARRQRQVVIWPGGPARWLQLLSPGLFDQLILRVFIPNLHQRARRQKA